MKKANFFKAAALSVALVPAISSAADRVGDFALLDQDGYFHSMSWYNDHTAIALLVQANDSADTEAALPAFDALKAKYDAQGIEFMMINPLGKENRDEVIAKLADYGVDMPVLMDDPQVASKALGIDKTGEVIIYNPNSFSVEYKGSVDQAEQAIQELLAGKAVSTPSAELAGSDVSYNHKSGVSYVDDVAPVLAENCASCHREGGIAPFAMDSHAMVQGWSPMIREVLMTKRMPPAQIDAHIGEFVNDMLVEDEEIQNIIAWADAGAPRDGTVDPLAQLTWPESKWAFGEPDMILNVPEQQVPATGVVPYINTSVTIDLDGKDRWLRGSQYIAGDRTVLHHTINRLDFPGESGRGLLGGPSTPDKASITAYVPGATPSLDPENTGGLIKDGSVLHLNLHYTTNGKETVDNSEIGLWFYPEGEVPEERMSGNCACIFPNTWTTIPANDSAFEQTASIMINKDAEIYSFLPHMHFRGKYMRFYADYPDGTQEELINISQYNYSWQLSYTYEEPKFVPAGTKITAVGAFDNSAQNPANPDPGRDVPWGQESWDEMFFGAVSWKHLDQGGQ